jgi:hypothetical protein
MKKTFLISFLVFICNLTVHAQAIYVDSELGNDNNKGTKESPLYSIPKAMEIIKSKDNNIYAIKINPGIYVLENHVSVSTEKDMTGKRIIVEATILPDDTTWTPEEMPVIVNLSKRGNPQGVASFLIDESYITIRGLRFPGYCYPNSYYFPIARMNKAKTDLLVEQCMFNGDKQSFVIQVGVIGHGDEIKIDHCVFYKTNNAAVFWEDSGNDIKTGNSLTNSIIYGASESAIWTSMPDKDFIFKNNIISNCNRFWVKNHYNNTKYSIDTCVIVNNQHYQVVWHEEGLVPEEFEMNENNITKEGEISLRLIDNIDNPMPIDYLHIMPDSLGYNLGAGLFKKRKQ